MAIDSALKRASVQAYTFGLMRPPPSGSVGKPQRATVTWLFSGLDYQPAQPPTFTIAAYMNGTAVDNDGTMGAEFIDDVTAVPGTAVFIDGFAHTPEGLRYVALWPASDAVVYNQGIAARHDGAMIIATVGTIAAYCAGWGVTSRGEVLSTTDDPQVILAGFGLRNTGALSSSEVA